MLEDPYYSFVFEYKKKKAHKTRATNPTFI